MTASSVTRQDHPHQQRQVYPSDDPPTQASGLPFIINFVFASALFFDLFWYASHIYRHRPLTVMISPEVVEWLISFTWGAVVLYLGRPLVRGRLDIITNPAPYLPTEVSRIFLKWSTVAVLMVVYFAIHYTIKSVDVLRLVYHNHGESSITEPPKVVIAGVRYYFNDRSLSVFDAPSNGTTIAVTGRHNLYHAEFQSTDPSRWWRFRKAEDLSFFQPRDLKVDIVGSSDQDVGSFTVRYASDERLADQCAIIFPHAIGDTDACAVVVHNIMDSLTATPEGGGWRREQQNKVRYGDTTYKYSYSPGADENNLRIEVPTGLIASSPNTAFGQFRIAGEQARREMATDFARDIGAIGFEGGLVRTLFNTPELRESLEGSSVIGRCAGVCEGYPVAWQTSRRQRRRTDRATA